MADDHHLFAALFPTEKELRDALEVLLCKLPGVSHVRPHHGGMEYGKDLVFETRGPLGEHLLNACVVKNIKISGDVERGSSARNVLYQAQQALDTPVISSSGEPVFISTVYIFSPYDLRPEALGSIAEPLQRLKGRIVFRCGVELRTLFEEYWLEFLIRNAGLLHAYATQAKNEFDSNSQLTNVLNQHPMFCLPTRVFSELYVAPSFVAPRIRYSPIARELRLPRQCGEQQLKTLAGAIAQITQLFASAPLWAEDGVGAVLNEASGKAARVLGDLIEFWSKEYQHVKKREKTPRSVATIQLPGELYQEWENVRQVVEGGLKTWREKLQRASKLWTSAETQSTDILKRPEFLDLCDVAQVDRAAPMNLKSELVGDPIRFGEDLLDQIDTCVLITGAPGIGKTSFCKWQFHHDAQRLLQSKREHFPVRVPLHELAKVDVSNFEEVFLKPFGADVVLSKLRVRSRPPILRLYLDGLDEVPEIKQQQALVELARLGSREHRDIQIVITARDHVSGPWLRWLPRLHLSELNESQVRQLATNWLDGDAIRVRLFFDQISKTPTLESLMHVPLLGSLILSIFKKGMPVPESKNDLYRVFIELLCGSWDWAKGTWRNPEFGWTVKKRVLTKFASLLHWRSKREASTDVFSQAVNAAAASLLDHSASLLSQLVADGLLMKSGGMYLFTHLSFQEYLTACELADPATESGVRYRALERFTRGDDWWKEVMKFFVDMSAERSEMERWLGVARRGRTPGAQYEKRLRMLLDN